MTPTEIARRSTREKFEVMESLWDDMRRSAGECEIPPDHLELLDAR